MATTQFCFGSIDGSVPALDCRNATVEAVAVTGTSAATTAAADADSTMCRVATDTAVYVSFGSSPNATSDTIKFFLPSGGVEYFRLKSGDKGAAVTA